MNAVVVNIFGSRDLGFTVGGDVAVFLRNYFFVRDGTVTAFVRALKVRIIILLFFGGSLSLNYFFLADCLYQALFLGAFELLEPFHE